MSGQGAERGGRYQRSFDGLVGAMILTVVAVVGFAVFRDVFSKDVDRSEPVPVDYLDAVEALQANGVRVVYPPTLPEGWVARDVDFEPGERPSFGLDLVTADGDFVGLRQADEDAEDLLETNVDEDPLDDEPLEGVGTVVPTWDGWRDEGGDHAFTASVGEDTVLVYGSVAADELAELVALLTLEDVSPTSPSPPGPS